jgi:MOSC domain-containing protein YiiM
MSGRVISINRSNGGVPKLAVPEARATVNGLDGDRQRDRRFHGGAKRALSLYSLELIEQLQLEGHPIVPGAVGENVTLGGVDWRMMQPGRRLTIGEVEIELTSYASPCKTIRRAFLDEEFTRISHKLHPGWSRVYSRVVREGLLRVGDEVVIGDELPTLFDQ